MPNFLWASSINVAGRIIFFLSLTSTYHLRFFDFASVNSIKILMICDVSGMAKHWNANSEMAVWPCHRDAVLNAVRRRHRPLAPREIWSWWEAVTVLMRQKFQVECEYNIWIHVNSLYCCFVYNNKEFMSRKVVTQAQIINAEGVDNSLFIDWRLDATSRSIFSRIFSRYSP